MSIREMAKAWAKSRVFVDDNGVLVLFASPDKLSEWGHGGLRFTQEHVEILRSMFEETFLYARRVRPTRAKRKETCK